MKLTLVRALCVSLFAFVGGVAPTAAQSSGDQGEGAGMVPYAVFAKVQRPQHGLFTVWHKDGRVALELRPDQFERDFIETAVPINGLGGYFVTSGQNDFQEARIVRFVRASDKAVSIVWPHTRFLATPNTPLANSVRASTADSVVTLAKVMSVDPLTGNVVFDVSGLLGDVMDLTDALNQAIADPNDPRTDYRLDSDRTYFGPSKAFPKNVLLEADQTFVSFKPAVIDTVTDPRSVQVKVHYNFAELPVSPAYMPRLFDDRVGYWDNAHVDFSRDYRRDDRVHYILRWNVEPSDPTARLSDAKQPIVYYLSNTIPYQYRAPIRDALLTWNRAFERIGISHAIQVKDQPDDPTWDPDDIRYNVVRWLAESNNGGFAEAQVLYDPYSGQIFRSQIVIDSDLMRFGKLEYLDLTQPERAARMPHGHFTDSNFAAGEHDQYAYGLLALSLMNGLDADRIPQSYSFDFLKSIVLHESGHDFGLMHNFIGSEAYTAKQLQSKAFTHQYGIATSVMEYAPLNLWPKGVSNGDYFQTVLGPYDYYIIKWGYGHIAGAHSPDEERAVLNRWASAWTDPRYRLASDEDVSWTDAHASDPRVSQWDLSNDNIAWCTTQMNMAHGLLGTLGRRFPSVEQPYEEERAAFGRLVGHYATCARIVAHYIGGEYLSRAHRGDPHAAPPLSYVPIAQQKRAFATLNRYVFSPQAWNLSPSLMKKLVYTERETDWGYDPPVLHGVSASQLAAALQRSIYARFFAPAMLQRLDDIASKYGHRTMDLADLFAWMQQSVYGDLPRLHGAMPLVHRNLQRAYAQLLSRVANAPARGTPSDAQALARYELRQVRGDVAVALRGSRLDLVTRAHLEALAADVGRALETRSVVPVTPTGG